MTQTVTIEIAEPSAGELRSIAREERRSVNEVGARLIEEGLRLSRFPDIEFRSFNGDRDACVKGALQVWQLVMVAQDYDMDVEKVASHLSLRSEQVRSALGYYAAYPAEIDRAIAENDMGEERLRDLLPNLRVFAFPAKDPPSSY